MRNLTSVEQFARLMLANHSSDVWAYQSPAGGIVLAADTTIRTPASGMKARALFIVYSLIGFTSFHFASDPAGDDDRLSMDFKASNNVGSLHTELWLPMTGTDADDVLAVTTVGTPGSLDLMVYGFDVVA